MMRLHHHIFYQISVLYVGGHLKTRHEWALFEAQNPSFLKPILFTSFPFRKVSLKGTLNGKSTKNGKKTTNSSINTTWLVEPSDRYGDTGRQRHRFQISQAIRKPVKTAHRLRVSRRPKPVKSAHRGKSKIP